ncbi:MAG: energy transducer TonB [Polyangiaceae bacterium]|nr:energy transducer TonB [Polyangiaceae bacterium]MCW5791984.1 energy transducer TonB [Polyangiaceae bacterium]
MPSARARGVSARAAMSLLGSFVVHGVFGWLALSARAEPREAPRRELLVTLDRAPQRDDDAPQPPKTEAPAEPPSDPGPAEAPPENAARKIDPPPQEPPKEESPSASEPTEAPAADPPEPGLTDAPAGADDPAILQSSSNGDPGSRSGGSSPAGRSAAKTRAVPQPKAAPKPAAMPPEVPVSKLRSRPRAPALDGVLAQHYPAAARAAGLSGEATVAVRITARGVAEVTRVMSESGPGFGAACRRTVHGSAWSVPVDTEGRFVATRLVYRCRFRVDR